MKTASIIPALSVKLMETQLKEILQKMCDMVFNKYKMSHIFAFNGKYLSDSRRSGDHPEGTIGMECYLDFKELSEDKDAPRLGLSVNAEPYIHFSCNK